MAKRANVGSEIRDVYRFGFDLWRASMATQYVIGVRLLGLAGYWALPKGEANRMIAEKPPAIAKSALAMAKAAAGRRNPAIILSSGLRPLAAKASRNARRLSKPARTR